MRATPADLAAVCRRMRSDRRVALAVHVNPDTDAIGSAAGMLDLFDQLGVEAVLHAAEDVRLPLEAYLLPADSVVRGLPDAATPLYALDCGSLSRVALPLDQWEGLVVNIDHHRDNTGFGDLILLRVEASSTCEIVCDIARALALDPGPQAAAALYAGLSFDSGHFRHSNTTARTFACAAWLRELGVDVTAVHRQLYEQRSQGALRLWARVVAAAEAEADGRLMVATVTLHDYAVTGAREDETEGILETLRAVAGVEAAVLVKEQTEGARVRVSLRSGDLDVSAIAALRGGGGHRLAAGFSSDDSPKEVTAWLSSELARHLSTVSC